MQVYPNMKEAKIMKIQENADSENLKKQQKLSSII